MEERVGLSTADLRRFVSQLASLRAAQNDAERLNRLRLLEELKAVAAAAQVDEAVGFERSQRAYQAASGVASAQRGRGLAAQVALALRVSPWRAQRWLGWARILTDELPATAGELRAGRTTEWRAMLVARETATLSRADRLAADAQLAPRLERWGDRNVETQARTVAYRLDPASAVERRRNAEADRRVTLRPAPDTMCRLSALLPVAQGVAAYAALQRSADTVTARSDVRGRGQIMADTLVERLTGQAAAADVRAEVVVLMSDRTLLAAGPERDEPGALLGHGAIPADLARELATQGRAPRWLRRLYRDPSGALVAMDSHRRTFTAGQRAFVSLRDQMCRTPWCGAPIRHIDHVRPHADDGPTDVRNAQGLCVACNHAKQAPGWHATACMDGTIAVRTPTGHQYRSRAPDPPRAGTGIEAILDRQLRGLISAA